MGCSCVTPGQQQARELSWLDGSAPEALSADVQDIEVSAVSFRDFVLDLDTRELRRGGDSVSLSPKAYQLLEVLVVNRPKALSKSVLQERLWPDTFVLEKNLVNLVAEVREALGDDATHPRFVRTVQRFGYACSDARRPRPRPPASRFVDRTPASGSCGLEAAQR
jgi:DNA-binding winged helix-turn-helix (wHTH) protein